ncbi:MAG: hypothetical protein ACE5FJ_11005 [Gemmatimonadales bacterium]
MIEIGANAVALVFLGYVLYLAFDPSRPGCGCVPRRELDELEPMGVDDTVHGIGSKESGRRRLR